MIARESGLERLELVALLWSAKESALKALRTGLRLDTRSVVVTSMDRSFEVNGWRGLQIRCSEGNVFKGWWQSAHNIVRTLVADPAPQPPILLVPGSISNRIASHQA